LEILRVAVFLLVERRLPPAGGVDCPNKPFNLETLSVTPVVIPDFKLVISFVKSSYRVKP
jgi:hypothetical protein